MEYNPITTMYEWAMNVTCWRSQTVSQGSAVPTLNLHMTVSVVYSPEFRLSYGLLGGCHLVGWALLRRCLGNWISPPWYYITGWLFLWSCDIFRIQFHGQVEDEGSCFNPILIFITEHRLWLKLASYINLPFRIRFQCFIKFWPHWL